MHLKPSNIYFSQDSISRYFDRKSQHKHKRIGETLDDLYEGRCQISSIPRISVMKRNGKWFTSDNRRLWIFQHLERLKNCSEIPVTKISSISRNKFTTSNDGKSVKVRGDPGGKWYLNYVFDGNCYSCGEWGHKADDCDNPGRDEDETFQGECYSCGQWGHKADDCANLGRVEDETFQGKCYSCGQWGHKADDCDNPGRDEDETFQGECYSCGQWGHKADDCDNPGRDEDETFQGKCYSCGEWGHKADDCDD